MAFDNFLNISWILKSIPCPLQLKLPFSNQNWQSFVPQNRKKLLTLQKNYFITHNAWDYTTDFLIVHLIIMIRYLELCLANKNLIFEVMQMKRKLHLPLLTFSILHFCCVEKEFTTPTFLRMNRNTQNTEGRSFLLVSISGELYCFSFQVFELKGPQDEATILLFFCITRNYLFHSLQNSTEKYAFLIIFQFVCRHVTRWCTYSTARLKGF